MQSVFLVYKTDSQHSYAGRDIIGIATDEQQAWIIVAQQVKKEHGKLSKDQAFNLHNLKQTQGYSGEGEFQYEELTTDILL